MGTIPSGKYLLYAEDDRDDQDMLRDVINKIAPEVELVCVEHGLSLLQYLESIPAGDYLPCAIILDMNMPIWDGLHTLEQLKKHSQYRHLPAIMFTTSSAKQDQQRSLSLGAEGFLTKPVSSGDFKRIAGEFSLFCERPSTAKIPIHSC